MDPRTRLRLWCNPVLDGIKQMQWQLPIGESDSHASAKFMPSLSEFNFYISQFEILQSAGSVPMILISLLILRVEVAAVNQEV